MELQINKKYETRDGREAKVVYISDTPIHYFGEDVVVILEGSVYTYFSNGAFQSSDDTGIDLIKPATLSLKVWLETKGVDTKLFWKNCRRKHNNFGSKRGGLGDSPAEDWIGFAFDWDVNLLGKTERELEDLHIAWGDELSKGEYLEDCIVLGFGGKNA